MLEEIVWVLDGYHVVLVVRYFVASIAEIEVTSEAEPPWANDAVDLLKTVEINIANAPRERPLLALQPLQETL